MPNKLTTLLIGLMLGIGLTVGFNLWHNNTDDKAQTEEKPAKKPLYWVAPMDANYRRDKSGKSPMGMDLVPVYAEDNSTQSAELGAVKISPDVINNLGVKTAKAEWKTLSTDIKTVGNVVHNKEQLLNINPRNEGWIEKLYVSEAGDMIEAGQPLYTLYSPILVNAQEEFVNALKSKNQGLINASKKRLVSLQLSDLAIAGLMKTQKVQQNIVYYAPESGVVHHLMVQQGKYVKPENTMMSIASLDQVWIEAEVFANQAALIKQGMEVSLSTDFYPGKIWHAKIDYINHHLDEKNRTLRLRIRLPNNGHLLKQNMFTEVIIHAKTATQRLVVPSAAVIRTGNANRVVLALGEGRFKSIEIKLGLIQQGHTEILSGLDAGDEVVTSAAFLIDSESSKTSDFIRMHHAQTANSGDVSENNAKNIATVNGVILALMQQHKMLTIEREAVKKWNKPAATVDFIANQGVDLSKLAVGMPVTLSFYAAQGEFIITDIQPLSVHNMQEQ